MAQVISLSRLMIDVTNKDILSRLMIAVTNKNILSRLMIDVTNKDILSRLMIDVTNKDSCGIFQSFPFCYHRPMGSSKGLQKFMN